MVLIFLLLLLLLLIVGDVKYKPLSTAELGKEKKQDGGVGRGGRAEWGRGRMSVYWMVLCPERYIFICSYYMM